MCKKITTQLTNRRYYTAVIMEGEKEGLIIRGIYVEETGNILAIKGLDGKVFSISVDKVRIIG